MPGRQHRHLDQDHSQGAAAILQLNPAYRIVQRGGALLAGPLSGSRPPVPLAGPDIALLSAFLLPSEPATATGRVQSGDLAAFVPGDPPAAAIGGRIRQLEQAGVLSPASSARFDLAPALGIASIPGPPGEAPHGEIVLGKNFALAPAAGGFEIWSPRSRRRWLVDAELALLLCGFASPVNPAHALGRFPSRHERDCLKRAVGWLADEGLLVERPNLPAAAAHDPAKTAARLGTGQRWRELAPDGRIPVYFTPHMENHFPLALGMIHSAIAAHDDGVLLERFQLLPITFMEPREWLEGPYRKFGPGVWFFSNYMWSLDINLGISRFVKSRDGRNLTIHGGPSTPEYRDVCGRFMERNPSVDIAVHGEGEVTAVEVLSLLQRSPDGTIAYDDRLREVPGLTFRAVRGETGELARTPPRARLREPDAIPSPYLEGVFDDYHGRVEAAIVESNRGCPFGCTFCDWGSATRQKVRKFELDRVKREIDWIGERQIRVLWIADANFGMYDRDVEIAEHIVATRQRLNYPKEVVVNYTKNSNRRLVDIIRAFSRGGIISQGIISIQTTDETTLEVINRRNIRTEKYDELASVFAEAGLPLSTDLMIGLPGITVEAFHADLQRYFDADVTVKAYPTQLLPNSPMADPEYIEKYRIEVDENDFVVACHSFDRNDLARMKAVYHLFEIADGYGALRYVLRYLQWDHGVGALAFLDRLAETVRGAPERYPAITWVVRFFVNEKCLPGGWNAFYGQIAAFTATEFGMERDSAFDTALLANELAMPDDGRAYPVTVTLEHDFVAWFRARRCGGGMALNAYSEGEFTVDDPDFMAHLDLERMQYDSHQYFWELRSDIARPKSRADLR